MTWRGGTNRETVAATCCGWIPRDELLLGESAKVGDDALAFLDADGLVPCCAVFGRVGGPRRRHGGHCRGHRRIAIRIGRYTVVVVG